MYFCFVFVYGFSLVFHGGVCVRRGAIVCLLPFPMNNHLAGYNVLGSLSPENTIQVVPFSGIYYALLGANLGFLHYLFL